MNRILQVLAVVAILVANTCMAADSSARKVYLLTAKVAEASLVRRNSVFTEEGRYLDAPSTYKFRLKDIKVEQGPSPKFPKSIAIEFDVRDDYPFLNAPQVFVVVEEMGSSRKVLQLGVVSRTACISDPAAIVPGYEESYFPRGEEGSRCIAIDDQYQPADNED
jgi:hypothetical protein